jgi:hypothetical protein
MFKIETTGWVHIYQEHVDEDRLLVLVDDVELDI